MGHAPLDKPHNPLTRAVQRLRSVLAKSFSRSYSAQLARPRLDVTVLKRLVAEMKQRVAEVASRTC
jgi:hypothetical protein